jgi:hypothetical protein
MLQSLRTLKLGIIGFWAAWYSIVTASNLCDGLKVLGWLSADWRFVSGNFDAIAQTTAIYGLNTTANAVLFASVIVWELLVASLLWRSLFVINRRPRDYSAVNLAFTIALGLWMAFVLADEIFLAYKSGLEAVHLRILSAQLLSLLAVHLLPDGEV